MTHTEVLWQLQGSVRRPRPGQWPSTCRPLPLPQLACSSHSLAYAVTQSVKTNHATLLGRTHPLRWSTLFLWSVFLWIWINPLLTYHFVSHWCLSTMSIKNLSFIRSLNQIPWVLAGFESHPCGFKSQAGFWLGSSPSTWVQVPTWGKWFHL